MAESVIFPLPDGATYTIPDVDDENWGQNVTDFLIALPAGVPPRNGTFALTGDLSFGPSFGLVSNYYKSRTANIATAGILRLAKTDSIDWRNNANSANLALTINGSDQLTFNGATFAPSGNYITALTGDVTASGPGSVAATLATVNGNVGSFTNANITVNAKGLIIAASNGGSISAGNLTDIGTDGIVITGGTGAVIGSGTSIAQHVADASHNGYLSSADWTTFNSGGNPLTTPLTGFTQVIGTVTSSDTILSGIEKNYANQSLNIPLTGTLSGTSGTVTGNAHNGSTLSVTLTGNISISTISNGTDGQKLTLRFVNDSTGRTVTLETLNGDSFRFGTDITSFSTSGANKTDYIGIIYRASASRWDVVSIIQGFAN